MTTDICWSPIETDWWKSTSSATTPSNWRPPGGELLAEEAVRDAQMDAEQQLVAVATDRDTYILSMSGNATLHSPQTLNHSSHRLQFSTDRQYLLITAEDVVNIFWNQLF